MRVAVFDLGTNTLTTLVAETRGGSFRVLHQQERIVGLGHGLAVTGRIADGPLNVTVTALREALREARFLGAKKIILTATAVLRDAANAAPVKARLEQEGGVPVTVLTGSEEARLSYLAGARTFPQFAKLTVIDIGGGSVEFIEGEAGRIRRSESLPLGVVKMTERFLSAFPAEPAELDALDAHFRNSLSDALPDYRKGPGVTLVGVAGTFTTAAAMELTMADYDPARITGFSLTRAAVEAWREKTAQMTVEEQKQLPGLHPKRAGYIVTGFSLMRAIFNMFGTDAVIVSDAGLRYGVLFDWMDRNRR